MIFFFKKIQSKLKTFLVGNLILKTFLFGLEIKSLTSKITRYIYFWYINDIYFHYKNKYIK